MLKLTQTKSYINYIAECNQRRQELTEQQAKQLIKLLAQVREQNKHNKIKMDI